MSLPWYRQFWPWFLICLPMIAVVMGTSMLVVSLKNPVNLVSDDYYREGQEINTDIARLRLAEDLGIQATLSSEYDTQLVFAIRLPETQKNTALSTKFFHTTLSGRDFTHILTADAQGLYRLILDAPLTGKWWVSVEAMDTSWKIQQTIEFPLETSVQFPS